MFDFLKKPTHDHHPAPPIIQHQQKAIINESQVNLANDNSSSFIPTPIPQKIKRIKSQTRQKIQKKDTSPLSSKQVQKLFLQMLTDARNIVNDMKVNEILDMQIKGIQKRVYARQTVTSQMQYMEQLLKKVPISNDLVSQGLNDLISGSIWSISQDIQKSKNNYEIFKKKLMNRQDLLQMQKLDQIRMIKLKQGQITSKVGQLRMQLNIMEDPYISNKAKQIIQRDNYSKHSQKTKQAQKFIQLKRLERQEIQGRKQEQLERKKLKFLQQRISQEQLNQKAISDRHTKLREKFEAKQILKQRRNQEMQSQKGKFAMFLKQYRKAKPLYQQKIQDQIRRQIQERKERFQKMSHRKGQYNPLNFEQLEDFQAKYLQLKHQHQQKKEMQMAMRKQEQNMRNLQIQDKNYKGKFRYLVLEEMVNLEAMKREEQLQKNHLIQKKRAYSVDIKQKYKPKIDQNKRIQSQKFIAKTERKRKEKAPRRVMLDPANQNHLNTISYEQEQYQSQPDPKRQGHRNLRLFKQYIHQKIQRGEIKLPQTSESRIFTLTPKINYLKQQRQSRQTKNSSFSHQSLDGESRIRKTQLRGKLYQNGDIELFKLKAQQFDEKARRQQLKLKYAQHSPQDQKQLQDDYLSSIRAKLQLLNNVK